MMSWKGILRKFTVPWSIVCSTSISLIICSSLLFAAMETTSGALARILQLLSEHQDVQEKLRQEIIAAHAEKEFLDFDELMNLPYLEAVCRESLRL